MIRTTALFLLGLVLACAQTTEYVAQKSTETMSAQNQMYQIGVWSFILFFTIGAYGFYSLAYTDYSSESLLNVDPEEYREAHSE